MVEEELTNFKEVLEKHPKISQENLFKIVLVCKNCNHKDLLVKFIKKKIGKIDWGKYNPDYDEPYKPKEFDEVSEVFYCPKCSSSLIALSSEFAKNNIVEVL